MHRRKRRDGIKYGLFDNNMYDLYSLSCQVYAKMRNGLMHHTTITSNVRNTMLNENTGKNAGRNNAFIPTTKVE